MSGRETFFCWWEPQKEHLSFALTFSAAVGRLVVLISTVTTFTRWPMTAASANTEYGLRRRIIGAHSCDPATISGRAGPIRSSQHSVSLRFGRFVEEHLADSGRPARRAQRAYCGVEPATLFETPDAGETWSLVRGLFDHPHRLRWMPGNGGLALHTSLLDPADSQRV